MSVSTSLKTALAEDPGNWSVRIALAEALQSEGETAEAIATLRENPLSPISPEQAARARSLLDELDPGESVEPLDEDEIETVAVAVADPVEANQAPVATESGPVMVARVIDEDDDAVPAEEIDVLEPEEPEDAGHVAVAVSALDVDADPSEGEAEIITEPEANTDCPSADSDAEIDLVIAEEDQFSMEFEEPDPSVAAPDDDGPVLFVAEGSAVHAHNKASDVPQKLSAFSVALFVHAAIFLLLSLVVIAMPRPNPPAMVATISQADIDDVIEDVEVKRIARAPSVSSSSTPTRVVTAVSASNLSLPEADAQAAQRLDVTLGAVSGNIGMGMSFESGDMESEINFFGIRSKGSRIVLVIEAARFMLTDDKGGIPAYDKVKDDVAKMLAGLNRLTAFNIVLFEGNKIATFRDELVAASPSNIRMATEWLYPVNRRFEELGIREDYTSQLLREGIEPIPVEHLTHYVKAVQRGMEMDVNTMFLLTSGWVHLRKPLDEDELERFYRRYNWGEREEKEWAEAIKRAQAWLQRENEARLKKGIPRRVIRSWHEIVAELEPNLRRKPGPGYTMEDVEDQVKETSNTYYRAMDKKKPELNIVWFIGEDEIPGVTTHTHFKNLSRDNRGKMRVLEGLAGLENVTGEPE